MARHSTFTRIGDLFNAFGSAVAVSRAIESGRAPRARDLRTLGIEPKAFDTINRF